MFRAAFPPVKLYLNLPLLQFKAVTCYVQIKSTSVYNEKSSRPAALNTNVQSSSSQEFHYLLTFLSLNSQGRSLSFHHML